MNGEFFTDEKMNRARIREVQSLAAWRLRGGLANAKPQAAWGHGTVAASLPLAVARAR